MGSLTAVAVDIEESLDVQDLEDLREFFVEMDAGLAKINETHAKL